MKIHFALMFAFLVGFVLAFTPDASAALRPNGKIAFIGSPNGTREVYIMNPDGSGQTRLTNNALPEFTPTWSPSGRTIAFVRMAGTTYSIWLMNADGSNQREIPNSQSTWIQGLSWSPDGQKIAFGTRDIETISVTGQDRTNLMPGQNLAAFSPAWSNDGSKIAYTTGEGGGGYSNIFQMAASGGTGTQVNISLDYTGPDSPDWSHDDTRIIYAGGSQGLVNNDALRLISFNPWSDEPLLTNYSGSPVYSSPKWSPDGQMIVFGWSSHIAVISVTGGPPTDITPAIAAYDPDWQPAPRPTASDFDGDGRSDLSVWRPSNGTWYQSQTAGGYRAMTWGVNSDRLVPADYDGDGKADIAVWRPETGTWYIVLSSSGTFISRSWGEAADIPAPGDFDGDGKTDLSLFRPSTGIWYRIQSSNGHFVAIPYGQNGDQPVVSDYDADGRADLAVFRPSNGRWYVQRTTAGYTVVALGSATSPLAPADYDGDGRTDISIMSPSTAFWYVYDWNTGGLSIVSDDLFQPGDVPVPADYDGDGRANFAVFRPSTATWYIGSTSGSSETQFGQPGDVPADY